MSAVWTQKDGREIAVKDMSKKHILNCIRLIEKIAKREFSCAVNNTEILSTMVTGEMASFDLDQKYETLIAEGPEQFYPEIYYHLKYEYKNRS